MILDEIIDYHEKACHFVEKAIKNLAKSTTQLDKIDGKAFQISLEFHQNAVSFLKKAKAEIEPLEPA